MPERPEARGAERRADLPRIPGYRIEGVLGRGASGVVYRARQLSVQREVALKVLHLDATRKASTVKRLRREARLMAMLDHPNIVSAIDVGESPDGWWMSMELVEGQALSERLRRGGPWTEEEAIEIFVPLSDALQHAHESGVIHRDVKPANILLTPSGEPRLVDLGLARAEDEPQLTRVGATMGTPHYVSPEQARNPAAVDARTDVYSLAATLHHVLCGVPPFPGNSPAEVLASVMHDRLRDPKELHSGVSKGMSLVLRKALSKDPSRRHTSAREFASDLRLLAEGRKPLVREGQLEPLEGERRVVWGKIAVACVLPAVAIVIGLRWHDTSEPATETVGIETGFGALEERWRGAELVLADAMTQLASVVPSASERERYDRLGAELRGELGSLLFQLRSEADTRRPALLRARRFEEARSALGERFDSALGESAGFASVDLPDPVRGATARWFARGRAEIEAAIEAVQRESVQALQRWCEQELWPRAAELVRAGAFDEAARVLEPELMAQLEEAGVRVDGLDLERLSRSEQLVVMGEVHVAERYAIERTWRELDGELLSAVRRECRGAEERLALRATEAISDDLRVWASGRFFAAGLDLGAMPTRFTSRAVGEFEKRVSELELLETRLRVEIELEIMARMDELSQALLLERRYAELCDWWSEEGREAAPAVTEFVALRIAEARLLAGMFEDARQRILAGEERAIGLREGGSVLRSTVRLAGDPGYERFWVRIAPGTERAWRLGGPGRTVEGVRRVSRVSLEGLAGRVSPCLEVAFLRLAEGDITGADECYRALEADAAASRLGDELAARLGPLLAAKSLSEAERRAWARHWVDSRELERLREGDAAKAVRQVDAFLRDYESTLDDERRERVRRWRVVLEKASMPSTVSEFEEVFGADSTRFPRRGRVELRQRFEAEDEGAWDVGEWIALGVGWQAPRMSGVAEVLSAKSPTLLLRDPFELGAGPVEVEFEIKVPEDSQARLVVVSALGFHCALVTGDAALGRVLAGSRDLEGVVARAIGGEGEAFLGLRPGERHIVTMRANQVRGTLTVSVDGEECLHIEDLSPKDRARSTSISLRSLEPLVLLGVRIEASRRD